MKIIKANRQEFLSAIADKQIILFGAGKTAEQALFNLQIEHHVVCIVDNDSRLHGKTKKYGEYKYPVEPVTFLSSMELADKVILIASVYHKEIVAQCDELDFLNGTEAYIYSSIYKESTLTDLALKNLPYACKMLGYTEDKIKEIVEEKSELWNTPTPDGKKMFVVPKISFVFTSKCTLRCKDCRALMPYIKNPEHIPYDQVFKDIETILSAVDELTQIEFIGGETFLYPQLAMLLEHTVKSPKVPLITLTTNGTVLPDKRLLEALSNSKVFVQISDYGHIVKMSRLVEQLEKYNVNFMVFTDFYWYDVGGVESRKRNKEQLIETYLSCDCPRVVKLVSNGNLWACAIAERLSTAGIFSSAHDYEDIMDCSSEEVREKIIKMFKLDYAESCNYCDSHLPYTKKIKPGVQLNGNFQQSQYTLISRKEYEELVEAKKKLQYLE